MVRRWRMSTTVIHDQQASRRETGAVAQPIVPAVAYSFGNLEAAADTVAGKRDGIYYGRYGNSTLRALEEKMAALEHGEAALCVGSGMAAISTALFSVLQNGDHLIV